MRFVSRNDWDWLIMDPVEPFFSGLIEFLDVFWDLKLIILPFDLYFGA